MDLKILLLIVMMNHISSSSSELLRAPQQQNNDYAFTKFRPPPPPPREPTFIQRITSWFFPWGYGATEEESYNIPASPKIDHLAPPVPPPPTIPAQSPLPRFNPVQVRDTEPTTARTTRVTNTKCSPCNKVPWIPMVPTYQLPIVKGNHQQSQQSQQQQVYFKHYFGNENQYAQVPPVQNNGYKYSPPSVPTLSPTYGTPPKTTEIPLTTPIKLQEHFGYNQGHHIYGIPNTSQKPIKIIQTTGYHYTTPSTTQAQGGYQYTIPSTFPTVTTVRPNLNTIDTSVITFTTNRPQNNRPSRFTSLGNGVTNAEYIPPPNILPLEGENTGFVPIPIPNLSPTPIPPLFDAKDFHENTYTNQQTGFIKLVPLEPVAQLSNNVNVQTKPELPKNNNNNGIEVISSNLVAEFTIPPETARDDKIYINQNHANTLNHQDVLSQQAVNQNPSTINIDIRNNIDNVNTTLSAPIVVESLESNAADNVLAESENNYQQNVNQDIDVISLDQLKGDNDEGIVIDHTNRVPLIQDNILDKTSEEEEEQQVIEEESTTTTESNYYVKFEPSIQTAADLADEARKKNQINNTKQKDRETPLELLDSPIFHITPIARTTLKTTKVPLSNTPPPFKPIEDYTKTLATLWYSATSSLPITSSTEVISTTEVPTTIPTSVATTTKQFTKLSSTLFSGINLPKEPILKSIISSTKKPKQIQIVIPYTSYHKPSPFKPQNEQEIITYKPIRGHYVTHPPRTKETSTEPVKIKEESSTYPAVSFEPLFNAHGYHNDQEYHEHVQESKIVESKLEPPKPTRQLTKIVANNIRDLLKKEKTPKPPKIDIIKLQKSIDGWTEQTFKGKASTIALTGHTKPIPSSFLTTTAKATTYMKIPTTTLAPKTTFDPDLMEETRKQYDNILYKKDEPYVKRHDRYLDRDNELLLLNNNLTHNLIQAEPVKIYAPKTTLSPRELWKRLHITISPLNNEKIYVVTPQPIKEYVHQNSTLAYKPRFAIRPTLAGIKTGKKLKQEISRRMDDSMDLIETEETIDGRSKVIKIITPERKEVTNSIDSTTEKSSHS